MTSATGFAGLLFAATWLGGVVQAPASAGAPDPKLICLEQAGCKVESAADNDAAMRLYREHGPYDIVLTHLFHFTELSKRIRERNPEQAIAIVGACSALSVRFHHRVPVLREGFRQDRLVRLVESAIKPRVRILLVGEEYCGLWDFVVDNVASFELEVESNGEDGLRRYRERGPYDIVLTRFAAGRL